MAEVTPQPASSRWTSTETRAQFAAIAQLRWMIFRNGLRRKGGMGDLVANLIMVPLFLAFTFGPAVGAGAAAYYFVSHQQLYLLPIVLWAIFIIAQLAGIQLGQAGTTFDPTQLIRFPLNFRGYALIRVFFGLISPSNTLATIASFAVALGASIADPSLALVAFAALAAFAVANIFFTRMVFSWVDRWLSTRRAREVFTGAIFAFSMGIQWLNFTFNPGFRHGHNAAVTHARISAAQHLYEQAQPFLALLPPGLVAGALTAARAASPAICLADILGILAFAAFFFAVFAFRLHKEFRGENLSEAANAVAKTPVHKPAAAAAPSAAVSSAPLSTSFSTPPTISAIFGKEFLTIRRNTGVFYAIVAPLVFVILIVSKLSSHSPVWIVFPGAVAYTMMGISPLSYNSLGLEAAGIQFYFLAPIRMRDLFFAKNLINILLAAIEFIATYATVAIAARAPSATMTVSVLLWSVFVLSINMAIGNRRSVIAPKKLDPAKLANKQASPLSAMLSICVLILAAGVGAGVLVVSRTFGLPWILLPTMLVLAITGVWIYRTSLFGMDKVVADHRDTLIEVLCKAG